MARTIVYGTGEALIRFSWAMLLILMVAHSVEILPVISFVNATKTLPK